LDFLYQVFFSYAGQLPLTSQSSNCILIAKFLLIAEISAEVAHVNSVDEFLGVFVGDTAAKIEAANMLVSLSGSSRPSTPVYSPSSRVTASSPMIRPNVFVPIAAQSVTPSRLVFSDSATADHRGVVIKPVVGNFVGQHHQASSPIPTPRFITKPMAGVIRPELVRPSAGSAIPTTISGIYKLSASQPSTTVGGKSFEAPKPIIVVPAQRPLEPGKITVLRNPQSLVQQQAQQQQVSS
jgi:hypothetical protein